MTNVQHTKYRGRLPQLDGGLFLTDGGLETTLIFHDGFDLPMFAAFPLVESERGCAALRAYYDRYVSMAVRDGNGSFWRAQPGAPIPIGARSSVTIAIDSPPRIAPPSACCARSALRRRRARRHS
jgi:homocysteine S-methyltransferase